MKKQTVDYNFDEQLRSLADIDFSAYMDTRLSQDQIEQSTTLVFNDPELKRKAYETLQKAEDYYSKMNDVRERRALCRDFYIGKHWNQKMIDPKTGETITMEEYISKQGMIPIKQNQIRQHGKNMLGQFIENDFKSVVFARNREDQELSEMMSKTLEAALQLNKTKILDLAAFEEFMLSGMIFWKTHYGYHEKKNRDDVKIDYCHPVRVFMNTPINDPRLNDLNFIGEIHDIPIEKVISVFAKNEADRQLILQWFGHKSDGKRRTAYTAMEQNKSNIDEIDFNIPNDPNLCRVYEIWEQVIQMKMIVHDRLKGERFESDLSSAELEEINQMRLEVFSAQGVPIENIPLIEYEEKYEKTWMFWFLTQQGEILMHGETPYEHEDCPYTCGLFPLVDGEIWGFFYDFLDQQIQINRTLTMLDKLIGTSSKGALLLPEQAIASGWTPDMYAYEASKSDGVLIYNSDPTNPSAKPEELKTNAMNTGAVEFLQIQMNLLEQISGVSNALQGQRPGSGTPLGLYSLQASNAQINNRTFFEYFFQVRSERDLKVIKVIQQEYDEDRNIQIAGKDFDKDIKFYEVAKGKDLDVEISMGRATNTPIFRQIQDDILIKFLDQQLIDLEIFTELTSLPFADKLREVINRKKQEMQELQGQLEAQGLPSEPNPEIMAQMEKELGIKNGRVSGLQLN